MTITISVDPNSLGKFIQLTQLLEGLTIEHNYKPPKELIPLFSERTMNTWLSITMDIGEYLKLKDAISKSI